MVGKAYNLPTSCPCAGNLIFTTVWVARKVALYTTQWFTRSNSKYDVRSVQGLGEELQG